MLTIKKYFGQFFSILQRIGKAIMLPIAILPAAGLLLGFGIAMQDETFLNFFPFLNVEILKAIANVMTYSGGIIFDNLPLLFAVGIAVGLSNNDGVAALAAIIGFLIMNTTMRVLLDIQLEHALDQDLPEYTLSLGIPTLQTGVFGGILVGVIAAIVFNKYHKIELPVYLGFFSGKRFVPIITSVFSLFLGVFMSLFWPYIQELMNLLSQNVINSNKTVSAFIFGVIQRGLIPFGLHHIFYSPFWYEFGSYVNSSGEIIRGDQRIFFAQLADDVPLTAGTFMTGKFPFMMFGLPAAALAMYHEAKPENRKKVVGIYGSAALTSFLTGITEPIEFIFLFVAPVLFVIHTLFAGLSFMLMEILNVKIGLTFSGGVIDFLLFGVLQNKTAWWWVIIVGILFSIIYYFGFRFAIRKFNLPIVGREDHAVKYKEDNLSSYELSKRIVKALGGENNIKNIDSCITRLRIELANIKLLNKNILKELGASGVLIVGNNVQVVFGTRSDIIKSEIQVLINHRASDNDMNSNSVVSPMSGTLINLINVPDKVFSQKMMGEGFAIIPNSSELVSPVDGVITSIFPTKHAIEIKDEENNKILIHIGIDTIKLNGEGIELFVSKGTNVKKGDLIAKVDIDQMKDKVPSLITPIIFISKVNKEIIVEEGLEVSKGEKIYL